MELILIIAAAAFLLFAALLAGRGALAALGQEKNLTTAGVCIVSAVLAFGLFQAIVTIAILREMLH